MKSFKGRTRVLVATGIVTLVAGCATSFRVDPSKVGVAVQPPTTACGEGVTDIPVIIKVKNESRGVLKIGVDGKVGPPFTINWLYYEVLGEYGVTALHGPGDHGLVPALSLWVDPGDSTTVLADVYAIGPDDHGRKFRIRMEDEEGHTYTTGAFFPCVEAKP